MKNPVLEAVIKELNGIEYEIEQGRHIKVRFYAHGRPHMIVIGRSPGDWHAPKNAIRDVRRILRGGLL